MFSLIIVVCVGIDDNITTNVIKRIEFDRDRYNVLEWVDDAGYDLGRELASAQPEHSAHHAHW